ncbi:hypothetical protein AWB79_07342 [Caballeronia hypogeia]|uniref:DUF2827 domain-containing protein n=1 Tax=Caballeronia hypogeia TaxID=1777140 RepID=A0A158DPE1_9BURK|nr:DUF2827 domain-containing protein [Caballeronia hypogeia]SAK96472.1 hypothetical protein AWB79_07342 [Caballeronia hypogeia]
MTVRIGISVVTHQGQNIWQNGLGQNVIFLAEALQKLPFVEDVSLIDVGDQNAMPPQVDMASKGLRIIRAQDATDTVDVIFEMGGALDTQWLDLMRARGKKVVYYCCGQPYVGLVEAPIFDKPVHSMRPDRYDEIWLMPKDRLSVPMMRTLHRCDVHLIPFIWHPQFLEKRIAEVSDHGLRYEYQPRTDASAKPLTQTQGFRVAMFEPNISVVKTSSIPMLVCEEAYREDPSSVSHMHVLNSVHMKDHPTLVHMANSMNIVKDSKATFHGRNDIAGFMAQYADAVVSHQWGNDQNYLYLDVLYGGYPLIHNSPWLEAGYYYPDFNAQEGARQLMRAAREHDASLADYRAKAQRVIDSVNPFSQANLNAFADRLLHLCKRTEAKLSV